MLCPWNCYNIVCFSTLYTFQHGRKQIKLSKRTTVTKTNHMTEPRNNQKNTTYKKSPWNLRVVHSRLFAPLHPWEGPGWVAVGRPGWAIRAEPALGSQGVGGRLSKRHLLPSGMALWSPRRCIAAVPGVGQGQTLGHQ